jgi:hypothetical protein
MKIGPGSYQIPSSISQKSLPGIPNAAAPGFSFSKDMKLKAIPQPVPGVGAYTVEDQMKVQAAPSFSIGSSPKEDEYWNGKLYKRSPGPVYNFDSDHDIASPRGTKKVVSILK